MKKTTLIGIATLDNFVWLNPQHIVSVYKITDHDTGILVTGGVVYEVPFNMDTTLDKLTNSIVQNCIEFP